jgi:uncharacterized protein YndB with AHSA1/START domain
VIDMPSFALTTHTDAPVEEVWKLLHDPAWFPQWWAGVATVRPGEHGDYTMWPAGYPDFPMAQRLRTERVDGRVTISCLVSDLEFRWQLREAGDGTDIEVQVDLPDSEAHRLPGQRETLTESLGRLAALAGTATSTP